MRGSRFTPSMVWLPLRYYHSHHPSHPPSHQHHAHSHQHIASTSISTIRATLSSYDETFPIQAVDSELKALHAKQQEESFWQDSDRARAVMRRVAEIEKRKKRREELEDDLNSWESLLAEARKEGDNTVEAEAEMELKKLADTAEELEIDIAMRDELDRHNCFLEIKAGAGGEESTDWAAMLLRMYLRWGERRGMDTKVISATESEESGGFRHVTVEIEGECAYGWLKKERGTHRLVRISPFDSQGKRHTSFAHVFPIPSMPDEEGEVELNKSDLRIETFRASGAGGQHVNTTDSAVRIVHIPTSTTVVCQSERSQHMNKAKAMKVLAGRIRQKREEEKRVEDAKYNMKAGTNSFGHQIRSYVLQPYQLVKDARTGVESSDPASVLDGDIDDFLRASLWTNEENTAA